MSCFVRCTFISSVEIIENANNSAALRDAATTCHYHASITSSLAIAGHLRSSTDERTDQQWTSSPCPSCARMNHIKYLFIRELYEVAVLIVESLGCAWLILNPKGFAIIITPSTKHRTAASRRFQAVSRDSYPFARWHHYPSSVFSMPRTSRVVEWTR